MFSSTGRTLSTQIKRYTTRIFLQKAPLNLRNPYNMNTKRLLCNTQFQEKTTDESILTLRKKLISQMGVEYGYRPIPFPRDHLNKYLPKAQEELPPRRMKDSFMAAIIPLSTDLNLQDRYITFLGHVRIGRLLEDMDMFAVLVAYKHIKVPTVPENVFPYTLVTVLVDKIGFTSYTPTPQEDIRISGHVSWVGKSSIEVVVWLEQKHLGQWQRITRALFVMAARDATGQKAAVINPLVAGNEREKQILTGGELRKNRRVKVAKEHLTKVIPTEEEQKEVHELYLRTINVNEVNLKYRKIPGNAVWMEFCTLTNMIFSQPEDRNLHNSVFGGFIMRQATELSWSLGYLFSKHRPSLMTISDISFHKPIAVNSLIQMTAHVVYAKRQHFQITVYAQIRDPATGSSTTTNTFHFTYAVPEIVPEVFPSTYDEIMMYIDGRRHFLHVFANEVGDDVVLDYEYQKSKL